MPSVSFHVLYRGDDEGDGAVFSYTTPAEPQVEYFPPEKNR